MPLGVATEGTALGKEQEMTAVRPTSTRQNAVWMLLSCLALLILFVACGQNPQVSQAQLTLNQESYDFGTISTKQQVVQELEFTNTGTEALLIRDVLPVPPPGGVG